MRLGVVLYEEVSNKVYKLSAPVDWLEVPAKLCLGVVKMSYRKDTGDFSIIEDASYETVQAKLRTIISSKSEAKRAAELKKKNAELNLRGSDKRQRNGKERTMKA